jgi:hypothetical protein
LEDLVALSTDCEGDIYVFIYWNGKISISRRYMFDLWQKATENGKDSILNTSLTPPSAFELWGGFVTVK